MKLWAKEHEGYPNEGKCQEVLKVIIIYISIFGDI
jgi:hypothetical protein